MFERLRVFISRVFAALLILLIFVSSSQWDDRAPVVSSLLFLCGIILVGIASVGRLWCSVYIGGYKTGTLITQGPYSMCRNPLYFFSLLGALGVGFATGTFLFPLIILIAFVLYYPFVIKSEENKLMNLHKSEFEIYVKKVPRFFPKISLLQEPKEYLVKPLVFKEHILSAIWFIWFPGVIAFIKGLHDIKFIPSIFKIY
jgi:protein-S-isoprenylcysteine O-methyltransferase Ste14